MKTLHFGYKIIMSEVESNTEKESILNFWAREFFSRSIKQETILLVGEKNVESLDFKKKKKLANQSFDSFHYYTQI